MKLGDLVKWVRQDHAYGLVGLVIAEPWCAENFEGKTWMVTKVLFCQRLFDSPEEVDVEDVELVNEGR